MSDKKIIFAAIFLIALMIIVGWRFHWWEKKTSPAGSVLQTLGPFLQNPEQGFILGKKDAPVTMVEYTNFLCSHCADFALKTLPLIEEKYIKNGLVKLRILIFPPIEIGEAALCSQEQNKFLEYHNYLFEHQTELTKIEDLVTFAQKIGLDQDKFEKCLNSGKYKEIAQNWAEEGNNKSIDGTPTFFISLTVASNPPTDEEKIIGAQPFEEFDKVIQKFLSR